MKENKEIYNLDKQGEIIEEAFPVSKRTKKDQSKTSVGYTLVAVLLHILAFAPILAVTIVLAAKCYQLAPYYSFWPFVGVIIAGVFGLIFLAVTLTVTRKNSKSSIGGQTVKVAITFVCLTSVFALLLTYILPDAISFATQNTLFAEDIYYKGSEQAEINAKLDRDFIMYNLLNGSLNADGKQNGDYSYRTLSKRDKESGVYENEEIEQSVRKYIKDYSMLELQTDIIDAMAKKQPRKHELYQFVYKTYVLNDFSYAMINNIERRAFALALVDYEYAHSGYETLLKEGFKNKKIKQLFDDNYDNFNQDGYQTFDDPLLLYAQMNGRMTVPVVLRLILNGGWSYSQGVQDETGKVYYTEENTFLYEIRDPEAQKAFEQGDGHYDYIGKLMNRDGQEVDVRYGINDDGWMVFENGVVKRPMKWLVLDMLGDPMDLVNFDLYTWLSGILAGVKIGDISINLSPDMLAEAVNGILAKLGGLMDSVGGLLQVDLSELIQFATDGAKLNINVCMDDNNCLAVSISPMNAQYGMLGYMQATWVQSNNLLMAVINVLGLRNWLCIFGAVGVVLVIAAGVLRECGRRTRVRTAVSRDRIIRAQTAEKLANGEIDPAAETVEGDAQAEESVIEEKGRKKREKKKKETPQEFAEVTAEGQFAPIEEAGEEDKGKRKRDRKHKNADEADFAEVAGDDAVAEDEKGKRKRDKKQKADDIAFEEVTVDNAETDEPKGWRKRDKKQKSEEEAFEQLGVDDTVEEPKGWFKRDKKKKEEEIAVPEEGIQPPPIDMPSED